MKAYKNLLLIIIALIVLVSCQEFFGVSPIAFLQRPIESLPIEQQITRANDALASGDPELMLEAYDVFNAYLAEGDNPEISLLAADLAFGASGITDFFSSVIADPESIGSEEDLEALLGDLDTDLILEGASHLQDAADGEVEVSESQYFLAGAAMLVAAVDTAGGFDALEGLESGDPGYDDYQEALDFLESGDAGDLIDMFIDDGDPVTSTVVYDGNGNTGGSVPVDTNNYESGDTITVLANSGSLVKTGYTFVGWNTSSDGNGSDRAAGATFVIDDADVRLYAKWTANTYGVVYDGNGNTGGSVPVDSNNYESGNTVTVLANSGSLAKTGYTFAGWNTSADGNGTSRAAGVTFSIGGADVTLYAKWTTGATYTVIYDGNGNTGGVVPVDSNNYESGSTVTVLTNTGSLVKTGQTFAGWNTAADGNGTYRAAGATFSIGSADVTLYAKWTTGPTYTVIYDGNGNTGGSVPVDSNNYESSDTVTVLANTGSLAKTGYTFAGWNTATDGNGTDRVAGETFSIGSAEVTLYAKWTANTMYAVVYDGNSNTGGSVPVDSNSYESGDTVTVLTNSGSLTRTGYTFGGWNTASDGNGTERAAGATFLIGSADVTLYAKWTANTYTVVYDGNGNTGGSVPVDSNSYEFDSTVTVLTNSGTLVKIGHTFAGWNTASDGNGTNRAAGVTFPMGSADVILYAMWTIEWGYPDHRYYFPDEYLDYDYLSGGETAVVVESRNNVPAIHYGDSVSFDDLSNKSWLVSYNKANDPIYRSIDGNQGTSTTFPSSNHRKYPEETDKQYGSRIDSFLTFYTLDEISNPRIVITGVFTEGQILVSNDGNSYTLIWDSAIDGTTIDLDMNLPFGTRAIRFIYGENTWNVEDTEYLRLNELEIYENGTDKLTLAKINPISVFYEYSDFDGLGDLTSSEIDPADLLMEDVEDWGLDADIMEPFDDNPGILGLYTGISLMEALKIANYKGQILKWLDYVDKMLGTYHQADSPWSGGTGPEYFNYVEKSQLSGIFVNCTPHDYQGGASGKGGLWSDWEDDTIWMSLDQKMAVSRPLAGQADLWDIGAHELLHSYEIGEIVRLGLNTDDDQTTVNGSGLAYDFYDHGYVYTTNYGQQFIFREEFSEPGLGLEVWPTIQTLFWDKSTKASLRFFNTVFYGDVFTDRDITDFHPDSNGDGSDFDTGDQYADAGALYEDLYDNYYLKYVDKTSDFDMDGADKVFSANLMKDEEFEFYYQTENDPAHFHRSVNQMLFRAWLAQFLDNNNNYVGYSNGNYVDADRHQRLALYLSLLRNDFDVDYTVKASYLSLNEGELEAELNSLYDLYAGFAAYFAAR